MLFKKNITPELISLHIPKTAGTSFRNILKTVYGEKMVVRFDINDDGQAKLNEKVYDSNALPSASVIHGHFVFETLKETYEIPLEAKFITWMRDPVERVISNYYYLESRLIEILDEKQNNLNILSKMQRSLIEYSRAEINRNRQSKFLAGSQLTDFHFVGICEHFNEEIKRLSSILEWKSIPDSLHHNKTTIEKRTVSEEILNEIALLNREDIALYNEALKLRNNIVGSRVI